MKLIKRIVTNNNNCTRLSVQLGLFTAAEFVRTPMGRAPKVWLAARLALTFHSIKFTVAPSVGWCATVLAS